MYDSFKSNETAKNFETINLIQAHTLGSVTLQEKDLLAIKKINSLTKSCTKQYFNSILRKLANKNIENANIICDYIIAEETELNIKNSTKEGRIKVLVWLSNYHDDNISFRKMEKQDILDFLNNLRKPIVDDSSQRWIGSYNNRQIILNKFFRWLYSPTEPDHTRRQTPDCMKGIKQLPRKEITPYAPADLWNQKEHALFLKYCPSVRDRCYHSLANDMSARPHEILNLKIKDVVFKRTDDGKQYAEILIKGGKTKPRTVPLIDSIPYVKELINTHSSGPNPESWLFTSNSNTRFGSKLSLDGLSYQYKYFYKKRFFPGLLKDETVAEVDKALIRNLLTKPWNVYILRHSALTEKSQTLKEHVLRNHAGWTMSSKMPQIYIHYFGNESANYILKAKGILKSKNEDDRVNVLGSKDCPNCGEPNKMGSKFCVNVKCQMVLDYEAYSTALEKQKIKDEQLKEMEEKYEAKLKKLDQMEARFEQLFSKINVAELR